jgi:protein gp37
MPLRDRGERTVSSALVLPKPEDTTLAQIPRILVKIARLRDECRRTHDEQRTAELRRQLDAFYGYVKNKKARVAIAREQRLTEELIGEMLGKGKKGRPKNASREAFSELTALERYQFRRLAAYVAHLHKLLDKGIVERKPILKRLPQPIAADLAPDSPTPKIPILPTFNEVNENIGWARWSWNPVTGCLHNCDYCYARDIAERFYPQKFEPTFLPERLTAPANTKLPKTADGNPAWRRVFTCSMADLFGKWVPQEWIKAVFEQIQAHQEWEFLCLTKFPDRLAELDWPANVWAGTTVDRQHRVANAERSFRNVKAGVRWLSCEPLLEPLQFSSLDMFDWVVIGASTGSQQAESFAPPFEWVVSLYEQARAAGCRVYLKHNLFGADEGHAPGMQPIREWPR